MSFSSKKISTRSGLSLVLLAGTAGLGVPLLAAESAVKGLSTHIYLEMRQPTDGIESVLLPATGNNGLPATLCGLWWISSPTGESDFPRIASFADATWDEGSRTLTYRREFRGYQGLAFNDRDIAYSYSQYGSIVTDTIKISNDGYAATVVKSFSEDFGVVNQPASYVWLGDGHWRVDRPGSAPLEMRRIVDGKGQREAIYDELTHEPKTRFVDLLVPALVDVNGDRNFNVEIHSGVATYVWIPPLFGSSFSGVAPVLVHVDAAFPVVATAFGPLGVTSNEVNGKDLVNFSNYQGTVVKLQATDQASGSVAVALERVKPLTLSDKAADAVVSLTAGAPAQVVKVELSDYRLNGRYKVSIAADLDVLSEAFIPYAPRAVSGARWNQPFVEVNAGQESYLRSFVLLQAGNKSGGSAKLHLQKAAVTR